jgi:hypothetical protein
MPPLGQDLTALGARVSDSTTSITNASPFLDNAIAQVGGISTLDD